jgi:hypothetical protein
VPDRPHPDGWARCLPSENHCKGEGEWNHYRVEANDGRLTLEVNGHVVSGVSKCNPRKGYLALESEGSECRFRNLKIRELPSTKPKPEEVAKISEGFKNMYFGDLTGWQADDEAKKHWKPIDWKLLYDGNGKELRNEKEFGDVEFIADFLFSPKNPKPCTIVLRAAQAGVELTITPEGKAVICANMIKSNLLEDARLTDKWNRIRASIKGEKIIIAINGKTIQDDVVATPIPVKGGFALRPEGPMEFANLFVRELNSK